MKQQIVEGLLSKKRKSKTCWTWKSWINLKIELKALPFHTWIHLSQSIQVLSSSYPWQHETRVCRCFRDWCLNHLGAHDRAVYCPLSMSAAPLPEPKSSWHVARLFLVANFEISLTMMNLNETRIETHLPSFPSLLLNRYKWLYTTGERLIMEVPNTVELACHIKMLPVYQTSVAVSWSLQLSSESVCLLSPYIFPISFQLRP